MRHTWARDSEWLRHRLLAHPYTGAGRLVGDNDSTAGVKWSQLLLPTSLLTGSVTSDQVSHSCGLLERLLPQTGSILVRRSVLIVSVRDSLNMTVWLTWPHIVIDAREDRLGQTHGSLVFLVPRRVRDNGELHVSH